VSSPSSVTILDQAWSAQRKLRFKLTKATGQRYGAQVFRYYGTAGWRDASKARIMRRVEVSWSRRGTVASLLRHIHGRPWRLREPTHGSACPWERLSMGGSHGQPRPRQSLVSSQSLDSKHCSGLGLHFNTSWLDSGRQLSNHRALFHSEFLPVSSNWSCHRGIFLYLTRPPTTIVSTVLVGQLKEIWPKSVHRLIAGNYITFPLWNICSTWFIARTPATSSLSAHQAPSNPA
jgi:hypothetical protein